MKKLQKMRKLQKLICFVFLLLLSASMFCAFSADAAWAAKVRSRKQFQIPPNWKYEAGYTAWRMKYKLPANQHTYIKYRRDKVWRNDLYRNNRPGAIVLDTLDWTAEEAALFWRNYGELFKFHPSGSYD